MRIVVLSQWFPPEKADLPLAITEGLVAAGHEVTVLTGFPNYPDGKLFPGWTQQRARTTLVNGYTIRRVALYPSHDQSPVRRALNYLSFGLSTTVSGWSALRQADVVYVYHPPLTSAAGPWLSRRFGGPPFVLHVQDLWPDSVVATGLVDDRAKGIVQGLLTGACASVYRRATSVITIAPTMSKLLVSRGVDPAKVHCIPNWADEDLFQPGPPANEPDGVWAGLEDKFCVMFAGNVGHVQGLDTAVRAAGQLRDVPDFRLVIVGDGVAAAGLKRLVERLGLQNVVFIPRQPQDRMNALTHAADVQLVSLREHPFLHGTIPSKLASIMASGLPVICTAPGDAADLVRLSGAGWTAPPEDENALADCLRQAHATSAPARRARGDSGRRHYVAHASRDVCVRRIEQTLLDAISGPGRS